MTSFTKKAEALRKHNARMKQIKRERQMNDEIDSELVDLLVDEYDGYAQNIIPDLEDSMIGCDTPDGPSDADMNDAVADCVADRICSMECHHHKGGHCPEFRVAAQKIADRYFHKEN